MQGSLFSNRFQGTSRQVSRVLFLYSFLLHSFSILPAYCSLCPQLGETTILFLDYPTLHFGLEIASRQKARVHFICFPFPKNYNTVTSVVQCLQANVSFFSFLFLRTGGKKIVSPVLKSSDCLSNKVIWSCHSVLILLYPEISVETLILCIFKSLFPPD